MRLIVSSSLVFLLTASCSENFEVRPNSELDSTSGTDNYVATEDSGGKVSSKIYLPEGIDANDDNADLQKGATIPGDVTAAYLTIPGKLNRRSDSIYVAIKDEVEEFIVGSAIISINLEADDETTLGLKSDEKTLIVLYHIEKSGSFFFGAIPTNKLTISEKEVSFTLAGEGNYQIFDIDVPLESAVSKETNTPPLSYSEISNESGDADSTHFKRDFECPENFVYVKENLTPGLGGNPNGVTAFCVSKYEMRQKDAEGSYFSLNYFNGGSGGSDGDDVNDDDTGHSILLESTPLGLPFTVRRESIGYAELGCEQIGAGYSMIGNAEWVAMARDIAENPSNHFISNETGKATLPHGVYSDSGRYEDLQPASADNNTCISIAGEPDSTGSNHYADEPNKELFDLSYEEACPGLGTSTSAGLAMRRISRLSSGGIIWDVAGNAAEWVKNEQAQVPYGSFSFSSSATYGSTTMDQTNSISKDLHLKWGPEMGTTLANIGHIFYTAHNGGSPVTDFLLRGGSASNPYEQPSIFDLNMDNSNEGNWGGIRCIYRP